MTREELEKRVHEFAVEIYKEGYKEGREEAEMDTKTRVESAYEKGLEDVWECARKIILSCSEGGYDAGTIADIFGMSYHDVLKECKPNKVIELIKEYEEQQKQDEKEEIKVGDEVKYCMIKNCAVVTRISITNCADILAYDGDIWSNIELNELHKTGRHFPQIAEVLEQLKNG